MFQQKSLVSVIIPTLNEGKQLPACLARLTENKAPHEIIVVDCGSEDNTLEVANEFNARVLHCLTQQRAAQMNQGAMRANGDLILFLHADTHLPPHGIAKLIHTVHKNNAVGGAFARNFDSPSSFLKFTCLLAELRSILLGWNLGDQAIFCKKNVFEKIGGFPYRDTFEDFDFSRQLARQGKTLTLRPPVISSARRFEQGPCKQTFEDFLLTIKHLCFKSNDS